MTNQTSVGCSYKPYTTIALAYFDSWKALYIKGFVAGLVFKFLFLVYLYIMFYLYTIILHRKTISA